MSPSLSCHLWCLRGFVACFCVTLASAVPADIMALTWRPSAPGFVQPELDPQFGMDKYLAGKEDFGIAFAGGGNRGLALAQGNTRGLRDAGILAKARYLTTSSASIQFASVLYYQTKVPLDTLLGKSLVPEMLSPENIIGPALGSYVSSLGWPLYTVYPASMKNTTALLGEAFSVSEKKLQSEAEALWGFEEGFLEKVWHCLMNPCTCAVELLIPKGSLRELWILIEGFAARKYGITERNSVYCSLSQLEGVRAQVGKRAKVFTTRDMELNLPFLISQTAILAPFSGTDEKSNPLLFWPIEHTPLYVGVQSTYKGSQAGPYKDLGDMLVEPLGWGSSALSPVPANTSGAPVLTKLRRHRNFINHGDLFEWVGQATCFPCGFQISGGKSHHSHCNVAAIERFSPSSWNWSPLLKDAKGIPVSRDMPTGDAGVYDDLAHLPLLRRGVKKIVIYDSSAVHDGATTSGENLFEMTYLFAAFGQENHGIPGWMPNPNGSSSPSMEKDRMIVFEPSEFAALFAKIKALHAARKPIVIRDTFTVVDNAFFGIVGGWQVEIIWALLLPVAEWRKALPANTAANLPSYFPNYGASEARSHFELGAVSQFASWMTEKYVVPEINAMLGSAPPQVFV